MVETAEQKIAIIVCAWPPYSGGIPQNAYGQAVGLAQRGYKVTVMTPKYKFIGSDHEIKYLSVKYLNSPLKFGLAAWLPQLLWLAKDFDIIHVYYPFYGAIEALWLAKIIFGHRFKLIVHHEMEAVGQGLKQKIFFWHAKIFLPLILKVCDKFIILSWDYAKHCELAPYLEKYRQKFMPIGNGVDCHKFLPQDKNRDLLDKYSLAPNSRVILFVGGLDSQHYFKGVEVLLKALAKIQIADLKLLIIGEGNLKENYRRQAEKLGVAGKVIFVGNILNEELPKYYNLAEIFILPSVAKTESFSTATAEAQACGIPAIVADWPGVRQTIIPNQTGLTVKPGDEIELAEKIEYLLNNQSAAKEMGRRGRANVLANFDWEIVIKKIEQAYK